jgi:F420H(2)-dependent quinone reductase
MRVEHEGRCAMSASMGGAPDHPVWYADVRPNSIAWLVWHLTPTQIDHVAEVLDGDQLWTTDDWARSFGPDPTRPTPATGTPADQGAPVRPRDAAAPADSGRGRGSGVGRRRPPVGATL